MAAFIVAAASLPFASVLVMVLLSGHTNPFISFAPYGLATGGLLSVIALTALSVFLPHLADTRPRGAGSIVSVLGGIGAGGCSVGLVFALVSLPDPVDATTAGRPADPGPVPEEVQEVGWRWDAPDGTTVRDVRAAGDGAVVLTNDGVYALDTTSGEERWRYRRQGEETGDLRVSPGGEVALTTLPATDHAGAETLRVVAFDADTGRVRSEHQAASSLDDTEMTQHSYVNVVERDDDSKRLSAHDLDTGDEAWTYSPPESCSLSLDAFRGEFVVYMQCDASFGSDDHDSPPTEETDTIVVLGLSPEDGTELWRHEERVNSQFPVPQWFASDGTALAFQWLEAEDSPWQRVVLGEGGEELSRETTEPETLLTPTESGKDKVEGNALSADGYLRSEISDDGGHYIWQPFDGKAREAPYLGFEAPIEAGPMPLEEMLLSVHGEGGPRTVRGTPWDGADTEPIEFPLDFGVDGEVTRFFPAPGAVVVSGEGAPVVFGLQ